MSEQWLGLHNRGWHTPVEGEALQALCNCKSGNEPLVIACPCTELRLCWCCLTCELVELRAEVETLRGRIAEAIALHWDRHDAFDDRYIDCGACNQPAPCLTVQALLGDSND